MNVAELLGRKAASVTDKVSSVISMMAMKKAAALEERKEQERLAEKERMLAELRLEFEARKKD